MMDYNEDDYLMLSGIQHFYFCKRQWALIHIEQQWADNKATMEGNYIHEKADDPFIIESRKDLFISRAVPISSKELGLSGIVDVLEYTQNKAGIKVANRDGLWLPNIVEYKRGKPKKDKRDIMQLTAQVICLEEMFGYVFKSSDLYYHETNRRTKVEITDELRKQAKNVAREMHRIYETGITPEAESYKNCKLCSLYDICMPRLTKKKVNILNYIERYTNIKEV
jgi:CRISPR-associated exonuclease Cas4